MKPPTSFMSLDLHCNWKWSKDVYLTICAIPWEPVEPRELCVELVVDWDVNDAELSKVESSCCDVGMSCAILCEEVACGVCCPVANPDGTSLRLDLLAIAQICDSVSSSTIESSALPNSSGKMKSVSDWGMTGAPSGALSGLWVYIILKWNHLFQSGMKYLHN